MNKDRRNRVSNAVEMLSSASSILSTVSFEEEMALSGRPESFCDTDSYRESEDAVETLSDSVNDLEQIIENLRNL